MNKLSNSAIDKYEECSLCYKLHYVDGIRPVRTKSPLLFGAALDEALNNLLLTKDLIKSKAIFYQEWFKVNEEKTDFSKSDLDEELVNYNENEHNFPQVRNISWRSLLYKGMLFLEQYYKEVLPKIKEVIAVQEDVSLKNSDGDEITGKLDLIVKWEDGKTYLMDNKSSSVQYEQFSAKMGQQLPLYYYIVKEKYKLDGVGYIVLSKKINKNRVKTCKECKFRNNSTHKTCNEMVFSGDRSSKKRCGGEFDVVINPSVDTQYIINQIDENDERRVMDKFDEVNYNISNGYFATEHNEKKNKFFQWCPYKEYTPDNPNFYKKERKSANPKD